MASARRRTLQTTRIPLQSSLRQYALANSVDGGVAHIDANLRSHNLFAAGIATRAQGKTNQNNRGAKNDGGEEDFGVRPAVPSLERMGHRLKSDQRQGHEGCGTQRDTQRSKCNYS